MYCLHYWLEVPRRTPFSFAPNSLLLLLFFLCCVVLSKKKVKMSKKPRVLPVWMKKNKKQRVGEALCNIVGNANDSIEEKNPEKGSSGKGVSTGRRLRSNYPMFDKKDKEVENLEVSWSSAEYPLIDYKGKISYLNDFVGIAEACEELIKFVENIDAEKVGVAFDMEWTFSFKTGMRKTLTSLH